jgi:hypothetical protein
MSRFETTEFTITHAFSTEDEADEFQALAELIYATLDAETAEEFNESLGTLTSTICAIRMSDEFDLVDDEEGQ